MLRSNEYTKKKEKMNLYIKKLKEDAILPQRGSATSAGLDLSACIDNEITIKVGEIVKSNWTIGRPERDDVALLIYPRSSLATKFGVTLANCVGVVDPITAGK